MIEFKAECGHTVRAKDEDAGGVVRCSYCGRTANVPEDEGNDLDFLFSDIDQPDEPARSGRARRKRKKTRPPRPAGSFNPFSVILRMCYAALLITIVIVVGRKFVMPLFQEGGLATRIYQQDTRDEPKPARQPRSTRRDEPTPKLGLINRENLSRLYVASTPPGAEVSCIEAAKAPKKGRIHQLRSAVPPFRANTRIPRLNDGTYVVEVALPWVNDVLKTYPDYKRFRRAIEDASYEERCRAVEEYFLPDQADNVFVEKDPVSEQLYIVRHYHNVIVQQLRPQSVRALFLPKLSAGPEGGFSIERLLSENYIPSEINYAFNRDSVLDELDYFEVPRKDREFLLNILSRIGVAPYRVPDGRIRLFKIDVNDGETTAPVIREKTR